MHERRSQQTRKEKQVEVTNRGTTNAKLAKQDDQMPPMRQ